MTEISTIHLYFLSSMHKKSKNAENTTKWVFFSLQRKMSDTSSSPNLLYKDNDNNDPVADGGGEDDSSYEDAGEEVVEKKGRSRFQWSHTADCIIENGNTKDETLIHILLVKEPWNAGHGWVMKAWQNLTGIVLDMVVDGDKIFQGVSDVILKKRYQLYLNLCKNGIKKRKKETNWRMKKKEMI